jgi:DNA-binding MurR/RpiR family transcriptional regulator
MRWPSSATSRNGRRAAVRCSDRLLAAAPQIHVLARARFNACYLAYALSQLELRRICSTASAAAREAVRGVAAPEVLIAVSFRNYSPAVVEAAAECERRDVAVIAITDSPLSPLKPRARVAFELGDDSSKPFRSLVAPLCLAQALVVSVGHHLASRGEKRGRPAAPGRKIAA